jgi:hypothetical protein
MNLSLQKLLTAAARVLLEELKSATTDIKLEDEVWGALSSVESVLLISATNCPYIGTLSRPLRVPERPTHSTFI